MTSTGSATSIFAYAYDKVCNRTTQTSTISSTVATTYTYDVANRMTKAGNINYTWDNNGNLTNDGSTLYRYDQANRMISTTLSGATTLFNYNGDGVRLKQIVAGVPTTYTQDIAAPLPVVLQAKTGTTATQYLYSMGTRPVAQYTSSAWQYLLPDALGSVRQIADANGNVLLSEGYEPYGSVLTSTGNATSIFGYAGEQFDTTGLIYLRARYMQPTLGIFTTRDPWSGDALRPGSMNGFGYVEGNSVNRVDPSGLWWCRPSPFTPSCEDWMEAALARLESAGANGRIFSSEFKSRGGGVRFDTQGEFYTYPVFNLIHLPTSVLYVNKPSQDFDNFIALFVHEGVHQLQNTVIYTNRDEAGAYATEGYVRQELGLTGIFYEGQFFKQIYLAIEPDGHITWNLAKLCAVRKVLTTNIYTQSKWGDYGAQPVAPLMPAVLCSLCVTP